VGAEAMDGEDARQHALKMIVHDKPELHTTTSLASFKWKFNMYYYTVKRWASY
jgi:hypothetical protein